MSDCSPLRLTENGNTSNGSSHSSNHDKVPTVKVKSRNKSRRASGEISSSSGSETHRARLSQQGGYSESQAGSSVMIQATDRPRVDGDSHQHQRRTRTQTEVSDESSQLKYGAQSVIDLYIPVTICMCIVVGTMKATDSYHFSTQSIIWYAQYMYTDQSVDGWTKFWQSVANSFLMLVLIVFMTTLLFLLYKFRCYGIIYGWLVMSSLMLLFAFMLMYISVFLRFYNIPMDIFTLSIFMWNFGIVGMVCIHWKGPLLLQQAYLIMISALMALIFIQNLPDWTVWTVLAIVSVWDLVAVLSPGGPLRNLLETAQQRNEPIFPALIYSSAMIWEVGMMADTGGSSSSSNNNKDRSRQKRSSRSHHQDRLSQIQNHEQPHISPSRRLPSDANSSGRLNQSELWNSPRKRDQHPVEIHYEDGAELPPEVAIIQPTLSYPNDTDDNQSRAHTKSTGGNSKSRSRQHRQQQQAGASNSRQPDQSAGSSISRNVACVTAGHDGQQPAVTAIEVRGHDMNGQQVPNVSGDDDDEERGVKLGLGDFIFFSVLVGKVSSYGDWTITMACYVAVLVGLCMTLSLLTVFRKALPALPISIAFGLAAYFPSYLFVVPFASQLAVNQVFV